MDKRSVLIAHDERDTVSHLERHLSAAGFDIHVARDGYSALTKARVMAPDLILLDLMIGGLRGVEVKNRLNREPATINIPVIFITDKATSDEKIQGFSLKADDVVAKPFNLPELIAKIDSLSQRYRERDHAMIIDPLSELNNLHVFRRNLSQFFNVAQRYKRPFSLAVIDLDKFKGINDRYGHAAGDRAIKALSQCMKSSFRETDILIRYGGDEFVTLFPETDQKQAQEGIERFRAAVSRLSVVIDGKTKFGLSASIGLAQVEEYMRRPMELFELADKRMYEEKYSKKSEPVSKPSLPQKKIKTMRKKILGLVLLSLLIASRSFADEQTLIERLDLSTVAFSELMQSSDSSIPKDLLNKSEAIVIFPRTLNIAWGLGGQFGKGVMLRHDKTSGRWSKPVFYMIGGITLGPQIGGQAVDIVLVVMNEKGLASLLKSQSTLGGDAGLALGPAGRNASASTDLRAGAEIYSYSRAKGLYIGLSLKGALVKPDKDANSEYYGAQFSPQDILMENKGPNKATHKKLLEAVRRYAPARTGTSFLLWFGAGAVFLIAIFAAVKFLNKK